jgi:hypothetical protein
LSDFFEDHLIDGFIEDHHATVDNESGPVDGSDPDNTKAASTAAVDRFDSSVADEAAEKDQRQQEAEERANNQDSQTQENEDNSDDNGLYEVKDYLSCGNGMVFVEWLEQKRVNGERNILDGLLRSSSKLAFLPFIIFLWN